MMLSQDISNYPDESSAIQASNNNDTGSLNDHSTGDDTTSIPSTFLIRSIDDDTSNDSTTISTASTLSVTSITLVSSTNGNLMDKFEVFIENVASLSFFTKVILWMSVPMVAKQLGIFVTRRWLSWRFGRYTI